MRPCKQILGPGKLSDSRMSYHSKLGTSKSNIYKCLSLLEEDRAEIDEFLHKIEPECNFAGPKSQQMVSWWFGALVVWNCWGYPSSKKRSLGLRCDLSNPNHQRLADEYTPEKLTCPLKINGWKMYFLLKWSLFRGHVSFQGCKTRRKKHPYDEMKRNCRMSPDSGDFFCVLTLMIPLNWWLTN